MVLHRVGGRSAEAIELHLEEFDCIERVGSGSGGREGGLVWLQDTRTLTLSKRGGGKQNYERFFLSSVSF